MSRGVETGEERECQKQNGKEQFSERATAKQYALRNQFLVSQCKYQNPASALWRDEFWQCATFATRAGATGKPVILETVPK